MRSAPQSTGEDRLTLDASAAAAKPYPSSTARLPFTTIETFTPDRAAKLLTTVSGNRKMSKANVARLANAIRGYRWSMNGETIKFDVNGKLVDGQHRLAACVEAGLPFVSAVVWNVDADAVTTVDVGRRRTSADVLYMNGYHNNNVVAAVATLIASWLKDPKMTNFEQMRHSVTHADILAVLAEHGDVIYNGISVVSPIAFWSPSRSGFAYWLLAQKASLAEVDAFFMYLREGTGPKAIRLLRDRLMIQGSRSRVRPLSRVESCALTVKAWNACRVGNGDTVQRIVIAKDEPFPAVLS